MKKLLTYLTLSILAVGCQTMSDVKRDRLNRDAIYDTQLDSKTRLEVRLDQDGTARIHLLRNDIREEIIFQLLYFPTDDHIDSFHRLQYDKVGVGTVCGVGVSSDSGRLRSISLVESQGTNFSLMLNREGGMLPNKRRTFSVEPGVSSHQFEQIRYEFVPVSAKTTNTSDTDLKK